MIGQRGATRSVTVDRHRDGGSARERDALAVEEPLEIRLVWRGPDGSVESDAVTVTMRTPGEDFELVAGFLHGEGIVGSREELHELTYCTGGEQQDYNIVEARLRPGVVPDSDKYRRNFYTTSSCGVCGKASLEAVEAQGCAVLEPGTFTLESQLLPELPQILREGQGAFRRTGGLHAAGLFDQEGRCSAVREDIGRHNAVDKAIGSALLTGGLPASDRALVVSGRVSFEIVQKAVVAGVPMVVAVGAPSTLAVDLATRFGQTLVGFARDGRFNVYAGPERIA